MSDYRLIEKAMAFISESLAPAPTLEQVAAHVDLSPLDFQSRFCRWAGTTPDYVAQALSLERRHRLLPDAQWLMDGPHSISSSGASSLQSPLVTLEAVPPEVSKSSGESVDVHYGIHHTPLGEMLIAVTARGVCRLAFLGGQSAEEALKEVRNTWPNATLIRSEPATGYVTEALYGDRADAARAVGSSRPLALHVGGTPFQVAVWQVLLKIPAGRLASYSQLARALGCPNASRAVGNAVGANPVALVIPCHRVIPQSGALGGYRWGRGKKQMVQLWEQVRPYPQWH